jgi:N-acetylmuramoyl-L-alanine amidase
MFRFIILLLFFIFAGTVPSYAEDIAFLKGITVVVDPGHGGFDPGTVRQGIYEKHINLKIALKVKETLEETGLRVILTRKGDYNLAVKGLHRREAHRYDLRKRLDLVTEHKAELLVSIHVNAFGLSACRGPEVFYFSEAKGSKLLADYIMEELRLIPGTPSKRPPKKNDYFVLRNCPSAAVLVETGYLSNPEDRKNLLKPAYQKMLAEKISFGIVKYMAVKQGMGEQEANAQARRSGGS